MPISLRSPFSALALSVAAVLGAGLLASPAQAREIEPTGVILPYAPQAVATATTPAPEPAPPCEKDCFLLSKLTLRGQVDGAIAFELTGEVRAKEEQRIPLFGPPGQVRLDDVTIDGARASVGMEGDSYVLFTSKRAFTLRGKLALGRDWMLSVAGPLLTMDASLSKGRLVEGEHLSGLSSTVLHFDPMIEGQEVKAVANKPKPVFRLGRSYRFSNEPSFSYKVSAQEADDIGKIELPLRLGEKVASVEGVAGHRIDGDRLVLEVLGNTADVLVTGTLGKLPANGQLSLAPDERSSYEWWLVESDPEHRVTVSGEAKLVDVAQTHLVPVLPSARAYLVQRGQHVDLEARSLVRGDVLAAVARSNRRFVAVTGRGEVVSDETLTLDNHGLEILSFTPAGKAVYLSADAVAQRILHAEAGAREVLVPVRSGSHQIRVQSLASAKVTPLVGALAIPTSAYPITTSRTEITIGLPGDVVPLAVLGGDHVLLGLGRGDLAAAAIGIALACFGFRTRRTRLVGSLAVSGLWFVSPTAFVVASGGLFVAGSVFVASRFTRGIPLFGAAGAAMIVALLTGRSALSSDSGYVDGAGASHGDMAVRAPEVPTAEVAFSSGSFDASSLETQTGVTPVSISMPTSERYVRTSLQLATHERPLTPRVVYMTRTFVAILHLGWAALVALLAWAHRAELLGLKARVVARLSRRPEPKAAAIGDLDAPLPEGSSPF